MRRFRHKKAAAIVLVGAMVLGTAGVAFAYFTSTGTGSGSGVVGTATNNIVVTGTELTPVFPGGATGTVTFTVANSGANPEHLSNIHFMSASGTGCSQALGDFSMADVPVGSDGTIAAGATAQSITETGTLVMGDTSTNQNACEGATLTLTFTTA
jgi:hypothetical protein